MRVFSQINNCQQKKQNKTKTKQNKTKQNKNKKQTNKTKRGVAPLLGLAKSIYYIDKSVLVANRLLVKVIRNYIRYSSGVFFVYSLARISIKSFPAFKLLFVQKHSCLYNKKKITRWLEDMNFYQFSRYKTIFSSLAALVRKIMSLPLENKIHIFAPPCNILYIVFCSKTLS